MFVKFTEKIAGQFINKDSINVKANLVVTNIKFSAFIIIIP